MRQMVAKLGYELWNVCKNKEDAVAQYVGEVKEFCKGEFDRACALLAQNLQKEFTHRLERQNDTNNDAWDELEYKFRKKVKNYRRIS